MRYPERREVIRTNPDGVMPRGFDGFGIDAGAHLVPLKKRTGAKERAPLSSHFKAADYLKGLAESPVERFVVVPVDQKNRPLGAVIASQGSLNESVLHMREVFAPAIEARASAIIVAHNHPSGDATPSQEDVRVTRRILEAGDLLGIPVLDHLVLGDRVHSIRSESPSIFEYRRGGERVAERRGRYAVKRNGARPRVRYADLKRLETATWPQRWTDGRVRVDRDAFDRVYRALGRRPMAEKFKVLDALYRLVDHEGRARLGRDFKVHLAGEDSRAGRHRRAVWHARTRRTNPTARQKRRMSGKAFQRALAEQAAMAHGWSRATYMSPYSTGPLAARRAAHRLEDAATWLGHVRKYRNPRRSSVRRNPWPAFMNGVAGGAGFFAANTALSAVTRANGRRAKRRTRRA